MADDKFGLDQEIKIVKSRVRSVFTPHQPINSKDLFFGRSNEVRSIVEQINTPGQHALLYGERGVGKTSLANITAEVLKPLTNNCLYRKRCDSTDTFMSMVSAPLLDKGLDVNINSASETSSLSGKAGINVHVAEVGSSVQIENTKDLVGISSKATSPGWVAEQLRDTSALFVIDEIDAVKSDEDRKKLSELIKHLSDFGSEFKILVVGIAETAEMLTGGHPSVHRCLRETKLNNMTNDELATIVVQGADIVGLTFEQRAVTGIVKLSAGYPHFTHLLALKCAENAIANDMTRIDEDDLKVALSAAAKDSEGTLKRIYDNASRSYQTDMHKKILVAAAYCNAGEFSAKDLRESIKEVYDLDISQQVLNNYFKRLVSDSEDTVLRRLAKGVYRFNDPRMPSYIRISEGVIL